MDRARSQADHAASQDRPPCVPVAPLTSVERFSTVPANDVRSAETSAALNMSVDLVRLGIAGNGSYYIRLRARNDVGTGPPSAEVRVIVGPPPPRVSVLSVGRKGSVALSWTAPTTGAALTGYQLQAGPRRKFPMPPC